MAYRLLKIADEMESPKVTIQGKDIDLRYNPVQRDHGAVKVTLPQPDLFSQIPAEELAPDTVVIAPTKRVYQRVGCKMQDNCIPSAMKVGKAQGFCQRSDIERSIRRDNAQYSREAIREAVNDAVREIAAVCITFNSYRYYLRSDRAEIIDKALAKLACNG